MHGHYQWDGGALKSFIQNCRWGSCSKNLPPCHSLIPLRLYHPNLQSSALGCGSHLMSVFLPLEIQHHLSIMNIWFLLHIQTEIYTPLCIMIGEHLLTSPDKDTTLDNSKDVMPKAFPFQLKRWPSFGFLFRNLSMGLGEIWWKLQPVGRGLFLLRREHRKTRGGEVSEREGWSPQWLMSSKLWDGSLPVLARQQPSWMTDWAWQCYKLCVPLVYTYGPKGSTRSSRHPPNRFLCRPLISVALLDQRARFQSVLNLQLMVTTFPCSLSLRGLLGRDIVNPYLSGCTWQYIFYSGVFFAF